MWGFGEGAVGDSKGLREGDRGWDRVGDTEP